MPRRTPLLVALLLGAAGGSAMAFELRSPAFSPGGEIPVNYTCDGAVHWVLYGLPAALRELPEGVPARESVPAIGTQGVNDFRKVGYGGPCPPRGPAHRYVFKLYALDTELALPPRKTKADLLKAIEGHVLGQAELMGRYKRK